LSLGAASAPAVLPRRVLEQLAASRQRTQILTGWVQLGILTLFAVLYTLAPKPISAGAPFEPVPWVLGIYAVFTLGRLSFAYRRELPPWVLMLSAIIDVLILMVAIWSFHLQYRQPAAFYLKAPTLLYVFIFIALRALSYRPSYVLVSGGAAAIGWLVLATYAIVEPGGMERVTRDYVAYMTDARILVGAEIDKVISIVVVTLVLAYAVSRSRKLLESAVAEQTAAETLARFLAPDVAQSLRSADAMPRLGDAVEREAAAMFLDLRGFTRIAASMSPLDTIDLLRAYQRVVVPVIHRHGGTITTFLGDGIMVVFGGIRPSEHYAADAARTTTDLLAAFDVWARSRVNDGAPLLAMGIGVECGTVVCGPVGDEQRLELAVIGDPVNRAAKFQTHTKAEGVRALISASAYARALEQGYRREPAPPIRLRRDVAGLADPADLVCLG
jgi:adenylate cyclase